MTRAAVVGTGLIGGSIGLALTTAGHAVTGFDLDQSRMQRALELGAISRPAASLHDAVADAECVMVAVPVSAVAAVVAEALEARASMVTDVGSVKASVVAEVEARAGSRASRFVGGHPMAGSEQEGVDGADASLFIGATWVLTPTSTTDSGVFSDLRSLIAAFGAEVVAVTPEHHDLLVAFVSHVPQLAATTLMDVADRHEEEHRAMLRLAAGGFRDMTRIAAGHPGIWPDIFTANREAVLSALDAYVTALGGIRALVDTGDRAGLLRVMERAQLARRNLPVGVDPDAVLVELRVPVADRPGVLAEVTTLAGRLGVNVIDLEIAHSLEGGAGVLVMVVPIDGADQLELALEQSGYHASRSTLA